MTSPSSKSHQRLLSVFQIPLNDVSSFTIPLFFKHIYISVLSHTLLSQLSPRIRLGSSSQRDRRRLPIHKPPDSNPIATDTNNVPSSSTNTHKNSSVRSEGRIDQEIGQDRVEGSVRLHFRVFLMVNRSLDKTISTLEMELAVARTKKSGSSNLLSLPKSSNHTLQKAFVVIGINTAFSRKKPRDSLRETWTPRGHSVTPGGVLDQAVDEEAAENKDFLRLKHVEGYHQLSTKTRIYFSTVVSIWNAEIYVKINDDVHLNLGMSWSIFLKIVNA
ncbi:hypothetical protein RHSIM_Rhsim07G0151900 [Rhododendron simsii]|uniref:Hexosyltransferase n=1 Tax=Rhododendron simsii TaxID=118357 RepID=A0A834GQL9_RHOSS|nr:hypothetical protein RHSIM_Rhsim07G0151900 [Rhododendron simsii]